MNLIHLRQSLSRSGRLLLPVHRWKSVQFHAAIAQKRAEKISRALLCHQKILEAHVIRTGDVAFGRSIPSFHQVSRSRTSVRFHKTAIAGG